MRRFVLGLWIGGAVLPAWMAWRAVRRAEELALLIVEHMEERTRIEHTQ